MQKSLLIITFGITASNSVLASTIYTGKGASVHDSSSQACLLAEQAARLDAARQAESFVQKTVTSAFFENEQGLSQTRAEFIENTVYGTARLQGEAVQQLRILENEHIECTVEAQYVIDSAAIKQQLLAEQARVSRQAERQNAEASLLQELAANQQAYQDLQQQLPPLMSSETKMSTFCDVSLSLPACENVVKEQLALPYLQQWSTKLAVPLQFIQSTINLKGQTQLQALNSRVNQAEWSGSYQISLHLADPKAARNQEIQQALRQLKQVDLPHLANEKTFNQREKHEQSWRLSLTLGSDCMLCSTGSLRDFESINKTNNAAVKGNFVQGSLHFANWLSLNTGIYGENFALCEQAGKSKSCAELKTDSATLPAVGFTLRYDIGYLEAMHLFAAKEISLGATAFKHDYQRFELGVNSRPTQSGLYGAAGISMRLLPKQAGFTWNDTWDINLKIGYIF